MLPSVGDVCCVESLPCCTDRQTGLLTNVCYLPSHQQPRYRLRIPGRRRRSRHIASRVDPSIDSHVFEEDGINSDPEGMVDDFVEVRVCMHVCVFPPCGVCACKPFKCGYPYRKPYQSLSRCGTCMVASLPSKSASVSLTCEFHVLP